MVGEEAAEEAAHPIPEAKDGSSVATADSMDPSLHTIPEAKDGSAANDSADCSDAVARSDSASAHVDLRASAPARAWSAPRGPREREFQPPGATEDVERVSAGDSTEEVAAESLEAVLAEAATEEVAAEVAAAVSTEAVTMAAAVVAVAGPHSREA